MTEHDDAAVAPTRAKLTVGSHVHKCQDCDLAWVRDPAPTERPTADWPRERTVKRHPAADLDLATLAYVRESMVGIEAAGGTINPIALIDSIVNVRAELRGPDPAPTEPLDVARLRAAIHALRWCKASDMLHAIAHDDDDEDGYRAAFLAAYAAQPDEAGS